MSAAPSPQSASDLSLRWDAALTGRFVSVLLGSASSAPAHRLVVHGQVVGFAVRGAVIDVTLSHLSTWVHQSVPAGRELLSPDTLGAFRVQVRGSVPDTLRRLVGESDTGRSLLSVEEIPWVECPQCGAEASGRAACGQCGGRLSVQRIRPRHLSRHDASACLACWAVTALGTPFCTNCGLDRQLAGQVDALVGQRISLRLVADRARLGDVGAEVVWAQVRRLYPAGGSELVLRVRDIQAARPGAFGPGAVAPSFETLVVVAVPSGGLAGVLEAVRGPGPVRASECKRRCGGCAKSARRTLATVLGRHCESCGERTRLAPHPDWGRAVRVEAGSRATRHVCGALLSLKRHRYCGGCGDAVDGDEVYDARFQFA